MFAMFLHSCYALRMLVLHLCSPVSPIACEGPTLPSGVTMLERYNTTVGPVIVYQCQESGFCSSQTSSVCGENGTWNPDPSQVVCMMAPTPTGKRRTESTQLSVTWLPVFLTHTCTLHWFCYKLLQQLDAIQCDTSTFSISNISLSLTNDIIEVIRFHFDGVTLCNAHWK